MGDLNSLSLHSLPKSKLPRKAFLTQKDEHGGLLRSVSKESPEFDVLLKGHTSQATLLLRKRNELREVNDLLIQKKEEHRKRIEECNYKMIEFDLKLSKHREEKVRFEAFIQENIAKRLRSELKYKNEHQLYEDKCKHILQLTEKLKEMESHVKSLSADIGRAVYSLSITFTVLIPSLLL